MDFIIPFVTDSSGLSSDSIFFQDFLRFSCFFSNSPAFLLTITKICTHAAFSAAWRPQIAESRCMCSVVWSILPVSVCAKRVSLAHSAFAGQWKAELLLHIKSSFAEIPVSRPL